MVDDVWVEAMTSTVQQLVPIFEGVLFKQPKSKKAKGKKGKEKDEKVGSVTTTCQFFFILLNRVWLTINNINIHR